MTSPLRPSNALQRRHSQPQPTGHVVEVRELLLWQGQRQARTKTKRDKHSRWLRGFTSLNTSAWSSSGRSPAMVAVSLVTTFGVIAPNTCSWARARVVDSRNSCQGTRWTMGPRLRSRSPSPNGCRRWCYVSILEPRPSSSTRINSDRTAWARLSTARSARSSRTNRGMLLYFVPSCAVLVRSTSTRAAAARRRTSCTPTSSTRSPRPSPPEPTSTTSTTGSACGR